LRPLEGVRDLRNRRMLSQQELANRAGVSLFTIQRIERGEGNVRPKTGRAIAEALGVGVEDLLRPTEGPPSLEASDERFADMVAEASDAELVAMKAELKKHLPKVDERPQREALLAMHRCIAIYREQKLRIQSEEEDLEKQLAAATA
jgi:transcriptional regulator with XRE-family HTH domain